MTHPMSQPWLNWQPMSTFPRDGEGYLVWNDRVMGGNPEVVFWDDEAPKASDGWCLQTDDGPAYHVAAFTHWAAIPSP